MSPPPTTTATSTTTLYAMQKPPTSSSATTKQNQREMLDFIEQPMDSVTPSSSSPSPNNNNNNTPLVVPPEQDPVADLVRCIVRAADGRKADDIVAMRVSHVSTLTTFLVILSGNSRPQNQAIAAAITKDVQEQFNGMKPGGTGVPEGSPESGWMVLDYGSVMVHIMTPKSRLYYNVQGQWQDKGGEYMDLSDILIPNSAVSGGTSGSDGDNASTTSSRNGQEAERAEDDPFWS